MNGSIDLINAFDNNQITKPYLTENDKEAIKFCKILRKLSLSDNVKFNLQRKNKDGSYSNRNLGLVNFIKSCGLKYDEFILSYLRQLHPFMVIPEKRSSDYFSCTIDASYKIPLWIECYYEGTKQVISFHELHRFDKGYDNMYVKKKDLLMQPIKRIDSITVGEQADFEVSVVRGMESVDIRVPGIKVSDEYIKVPKLVFEERILRYCNQALRELYDDMGVDLMHSSYFERPKQISISSFAKNVPGQVSMLLDLFSANDRNDELTAFLLEVKICELKSLACYSDLEEYFVEKYHNYFGIDFSGLFVNGVDPLDED